MSLWEPTINFEDNWLETARLELAELRKKDRTLSLAVLAQEKARRAKIPKRHQGNNIPGTELCKESVARMNAALDSKFELHPTPILPYTRKKKAWEPPRIFAPKFRPKVKPLKPYTRDLGCKGAREWEEIKSLAVIGTADARSVWNAANSAAS